MLASELIEFLQENPDFEVFTSRWESLDSNYPVAHHGRIEGLQDIAYSDAAIILLIEEEEE